MKAIACILCLLVTPWLSAQDKRLPNIILFVTDDQSPIAGCYGSPIIQTPHLDALAADGVCFTDAYATTASCSASRSVILTGLQNHANGQFGHAHDYHKFTTFTSCAAVSLPAQLKQLGYRTAHIGKLHVAPQSVYPFDQYLSPPHGHNTPTWIEACKPLINEISEKPFFLCFWTNDPHRSQDVDDTAPEELKPNRFGNPPAGKSYPGTAEVVYDPASLPVPAFLPDTIECRRELAQYYQSATRTDKALGKLVATLKDAGQYENTIIVFTADHGMAFPGAKTTVYEAGLHVPFIVKMPASQHAGSVRNTLISHADITPSLLDAAGGYDSAKQKPATLAPVPKIGYGENPGDNITRYHGLSWWPTLADPSAMKRDLIGFSHTFHEITMYYPMRAIRDRNHKLIWNIASPLPYPFASDLWAASTWQAQFRKGQDASYGARTVRSYIQRPPFELYDLSTDPAESRNLAAEPSHADLLARMKKQLREFQHQTADPWILKWDYE